MSHIQKNRREFVQTGILGFCTALFSGLPKITFVKSNANLDKGIVVRENEGIHLLTGRRKVPITVKFPKKSMA